MTYERFCADFLRAEVPVIVRGVSAGSDEVITPEYLKRTFMREDKRHFGWFDSEIVDSGPIRIPNLVKRVLSRDDIVLRRAPMRLWLQPKGHRTLPHYDGNSLHGFNLQVHGRKHWTIVPPSSPLPSVPFGYVTLVPEHFDIPSSGKSYAQFQTEPGDLLFLPRYWIHEVRCLDDVNINVNWVFTPAMPNRSSALGVRECELLKARAVFPLVNRLFPFHERSYGGDGARLVHRYTEHVTPLSATKRVLLELMRVPQSMLLKRDIRKKAEEFLRNNFNVG
jgi:hypothetical protein